MAGLTPRIALLMTLPPLMWAGNAVVGRLAVGSVPPLTLNLLRWVLALLLLLPLAWRVFRAPRELVVRWPHLLLLGTLGVGSYNALQYLAQPPLPPISPWPRWPGCLVSWPGAWPNGTSLQHSSGRRAAMRWWSARLSCWSFSVT